MRLNRIAPQDAASQLFNRLHSQADCLLLAGSFVRGEATDYSDLDIVVLYPHLPHAYRESLTWEGYPVEMFVHDPQTLRYFFEVMDAPTGFPRLMQMVSEGIEVPGPTLLSAQAKQLAQTVLTAGAPPLTTAQLESRRYQITDLVEDIRAPRSPDELRASGAQLYGLLADFAFRSQNLWSATGKTIPRKLHQCSPKLAKRFSAAFDSLFVTGDPQPVVKLAGEIVAHCGGFLFEGYRLEAPADFRLEDPET